MADSRPNRRNLCFLSRPKRLGIGDGSVLASKQPPRNVPLLSAEKVSRYGPSPTSEGVTKAGKDGAGSGFREDSKRPRVHQKLEEQELETVERRRVKKTVKYFRELYSELLAESRRNSETRLGASLHMEAALVMKKMWKWDDRKKWIGSVPGIYVGDEFQWRAELRVIGLHSQFNSGIDYVLNKDGVKVAVSVVASGRYSNRIKPFEVIEYCGQGGNPSCFGKKKVNDQKLEGGNLALKNSMETRTPVRVIWRFRSSKRFNRVADCDANASDYKFVYCGLYNVDSYGQERGEFGKLVFKFLLNRIPGQPVVQLDNASKNSI